MMAKPFSDLKKEMSSETRRRSEAHADKLRAEILSTERVDDIWIEEAERRLAAYREGKLAGIPMDEVFKAD